MKTKNASSETRTDLYFGGCPYCGRTDGFFNLRRAHFFVCDEHRVKWYIGENLFGCWRQETPADWDRNAERYGRYADVRPLMPSQEHMEDKT
jgi:hypothetical protein